MSLKDTAPATGQVPLPDDGGVVVVVVVVDVAFPPPPVVVVDESPAVVGVWPDVVDVVDVA